MEPFLRGLAVAASLSLVMAACGDDADPPPEAGGTDTSTPTDPASITGTIRLYSYSDGFDPEYMETFFETYPNIEIETASFGSNEEAVAKIQAGFEADVVNSCVDEATLEMVNKGMYQPLDESRLENWDDIWPGMKELPGVQVDGQIFIVPVDAGTAGIMYNADEVTTPPTSWTDLFDPQYAGRASLEDLAITALDVGALANGISNPLEMTPDQLEMVKQYLIDHRDQFRTFWKGESDVKAQFKSGEVVIASGYPGIAEAAARSGRHERAVRRRRRGPDALDLRLRHQPRHRRGEPRCRLRTAELVHEPAAADLRRDELELPDLEHGHHRRRAAEGRRGGVARLAVHAGETPSPRARPMTGGLDRRVDRGEGVVVASEAIGAAGVAVGDSAAAAGGSPQGAQHLGVARLPRARGADALRAAR